MKGYNFGNDFGDLKPIEPAQMKELPSNEIFANFKEIPAMLKQKNTIQKLEIKDEFNLDSFDVLNKGNVLVRATLPGAGKTTNIILWALKNKKRILVLTPTNALAADIKKRFEEDDVYSITFCSLLGLVRGKDVDESQQKMIQRFDISSFDVVLIDEI